jgi:dienelactone hydrolase
MSITKPRATRALNIMTEKLHPCCDPTSPSPIWAGKSSGKIITIDGIETYIAKPRDNKKSLSSEERDEKRVLLHLTEGHSIYFLNAQLLADSFAAHLNCDVIMPDQFRCSRRIPTSAKLPHFPEGKAAVLPPAAGSDDIPPPYPKAQTKEEFEAWKSNIGPHVIDSLLETIVQYIHKTYGDDVKIAGVGYCFGGRYIMRLMGSGVIDVGVVNHPSFYTLDEVAKVGSEKRLAIYAAETDDIHTPEIRRATEDVLTKSGASWMSTVFSGTNHGFTVRGDLDIKLVRLAKERAFMGAVEWFKDWL